MNNLSLLMINNGIKYKIRFKSLESLENYINRKLDKLKIKWYFETVYEKLNLLNEVQNEIHLQNE